MLTFPCTPYPHSTPKILPLLATAAQQSVLDPTRTLIDNLILSERFSRKLCCVARPTGGDNTGRTTEPSCVQTKHSARLRFVWIPTELTRRQRWRHSLLLVGGGAGWLVGWSHWYKCVWTFQIHIIYNTYNTHANTQHTDGGEVINVCQSPSEQTTARTKQNQRTWERDVKVSAVIRRRWMWMCSSVFARMA